MICSAERIPDTTRAVETKYCVVSVSKPAEAAMMIGGVILNQVRTDFTLRGLIMKHTLQPTSQEHAENQATQPRKQAWGHPSRRMELLAASSS